MSGAATFFLIFELTKAVDTLQYCNKSLRRVVGLVDVEGFLLVNAVEAIPHSYIVQQSAFIRLPQQLLETLHQLEPLLEIRLHSMVLRRVCEVCVNFIEVELLDGGFERSTVQEELVTSICSTVQQVVNKSRS